jgi:hypothetical protein
VMDGLHSVNHPPDLFKYRAEQYALPYIVDQTGGFIPFLV